MIGKLYGQVCRYGKQAPSNPNRGIKDWITLIIRQFSLSSPRRVYAFRLHSWGLLFEVRGSIELRQIISNNTTFVCMFFRFVYFMMGFRSKAYARNRDIFFSCGFTPSLRQGIQKFSPSTCLEIIRRKLRKSIRYGPVVVLFLVVSLFRMVKPRT